MDTAMLITKVMEVRTTTMSEMLRLAVELVGGQHPGQQSGGTGAA